MAKNQITNGGPVIMVQVENEYNSGGSNIVWPDYKYMNGQEKMFEDAGVVVPLSCNDVSICKTNDT